VIAALMSTIFVAGFFVIGCQFCMNALAAGFYPTAVRSTGVGWALGIGRIGSIIGPLVAGLLIDAKWSTGALFMAAAAAAACAALASLLLSRLATASAQTAPMDATLKAATTART
jgi:AAHS family 4-hydroxybenzoate transporter-like MFS transporter